MPVSIERVKNTYRNHQEMQYSEIKQKLQAFYSLDENNDKIIHKIKSYISSQAGIDLSHYRHKYLNRRFYFRIQKLNLKSYEKYYEYILENPKESSEFIESFTIHVTEFFRDIAPFRYIEKTLLPQISRSKIRGEDKTIRILVAPCSTGEEAYSFAIIAHHLKQKRVINNPIKIFGYDIDSKVIKHALTGVYDTLTMKNISEQSIQRNFIRLQENRYKIKPVIKNYVSFRIADLLKPFNAVKFDLISCRNFLIYISKKRQKAVVQNLVKNLQPYGYLILGKTEGFPLLSTKMFLPENIREHIYKFK
jgi:chemotaxis methyl-accepting protein methylase